MAATGHAVASVVLARRAAVPIGAYASTIGASSVTAVHPEARVERLARGASADGTLTSRRPRAAGHRAVFADQVVRVQWSGSRVAFNLPVAHWAVCFLM